MKNLGIFLALLSIMASGCEKENLGLGNENLPAAGTCTDQAYINHVLTLSDRDLWQAGYDQWVFYNGARRDLGTCETYAANNRWQVFVSGVPYFTGRTMVEAANVLRQWIAECRCAL